MAAQEIDNLQEKVNWHWRNSMRTVRFFTFDARSAIPLCLLLFRLADWRAWAIMFVNLMIFRYLENKGLTTPAAMRSLRVWLLGADRPGWLGVHTKKFVDYG